MPRARPQGFVVGVVAGLSLFADGLAPPARAADLTYDRDIAPIVLENCAYCHRPGESGPFDLLTYDDVRQRRHQIVEVISSGYMPPWLPAEIDVGFDAERRLTEQEIGSIVQWVRDGAPEGNPADLPPPPDWTDGWQLGEPDLVIRMPEAYTLAADGADVFRNFVIPVPVDKTRWVRAIELRPGSPRVVHHADMRIDRTRSCRKLDELEPGPGFGSMNMGSAQAPDGHNLTWTPGRQPYEGLDGASWRLSPGTDFVLQLHMIPSGKPETIQASIGFHFASGPPTVELFSLGMHARDIDIPAGEPAYVREDRYELPVALDVVGVFPHAHYLGKRIEGFVTLPDGSTRWLLRIDDWDFNWQDSYHYRRPIRVPAGSTIQMRFTYDNSGDNPRNPHDPPRRVVYGPNSFDEMGSLTFEVIPIGANATTRLQDALTGQDVEKDPEDWFAHNNRASVLRDLGRTDEAIYHYRKALEYNPTRAAAMTALAELVGTRGNLDEAMELLRESLRLNPYHPDSYLTLGNTLFRMQRPRDAVAQYRKALEMRPDYADVYYNLGLALQHSGNVPVAVRAYQQAIEFDPGQIDAHNNLGGLYSNAGRFDIAAVHYRKVLAARPRSAEAHNNLGNVLLLLGELDEAIALYRQALELDPSLDDTRYNLQVALELQAEQDSGR